MRRLIKIILCLGILNLMILSTSAYADVDGDKVAQKIVKDVATDQAKNFLKEYLNAHPPEIYIGGTGQFGTETLQGLTLFMYMVEFANAKTDNGRLFAGAKILAVIAAAQPYVFLIIMAVQIIDGILAANHSADMLKIYADIAKLQRQVSDLNLALLQAYQKELDFYAEKYDEKMKRVSELSQVLSSEDGSCQKIQKVAVQKDESVKINSEDIESCVNALREYAYASQDIYYLSVQLLDYLAQLPSLDESLRGFVDSLKQELDRWQKGSDLTDWYWQLMELNSALKAKMWAENQKKVDLDQWQQKALVEYCRSEVMTRGAEHIVNKMKYKQVKSLDSLKVTQQRGELLADAESLFALVGDCKAYTSTDRLTAILLNTRQVLHETPRSLP